MIVGSFKVEKNLLKMASDFDIILDSIMKNNKDLIHGVLGGEALAREEYNIRDKDI